MKSALSRRLDAAIAAAATLTGKRFGLLVASSLVATTAIVAAALTGTGDSGALAALLASRAPGNTPAAATSPAASSTPSRAGGSSPAPGEAPAPQPTSSPSPPPTSSSAPSGPAAEPAPQSAPATPPPQPEAGRIKHVFVVSLASPGYEAAFGAAPQMPYLASTLRPRGQLLSGYSLLDEAGLPNGAAAISGQPPNASTRAGCPTYAEFPAGAAPGANGVVSGSGCVYPVEALTIADQLTSARFTWRAYADGMEEGGKPANCAHPSPGEAEEAAPGGYLAAQNPFVYFHSLLDLGDCAADDVPIDGLTADLRKTEKTANYSFIAPTPCDAGAGGQCPAGAAEGPAAADAFLAKWVPQILASPAYKKDGLLIVTFVAANPPVAEPAPPSTADPLRVGALLLSHFVAPGSTDATPLDPYSLLRSSEDLFGLEHLGLAAPAKVNSFAPGLLGETGGD